MKNQPQQTPNQSGQTDNPKPTCKKENLLQVVKFTLFSISAGVIQIGLTELLVLCGLKDNLYWIAYIIGLAASIIWNFTFNRKFTFKSSNNIPVAMILAGLFYVAFAPLSTLWSDALVVQAGWPELLVTAFTMVINFALEFVWQKFVVFNDKVVNFITRKNTSANNTAKVTKQKLADTQPTTQTQEQPVEQTQQQEQSKLSTQPKSAKNSTKSNKQ